MNSWELAIANKNKTRLEHWKKDAEDGERVLNEINQSIPSAHWQIINQYELLEFYFGRS